MRVVSATRVLWVEAKDHRRARGEVTCHRQMDIGRYLVEGEVVPRVNADLQWRPWTRSLLEKDNG